MRSLREEYWRTGGKPFVLQPDTVLEVAEDYDAGLGTVRGEVLDALDGNDAHGRDGFGNALWKATKAAILLEGDLDIGVVGNKTIFFLHVGIVPGGMVNKISEKRAMPGPRVFPKDLFSATIGFLGGVCILKITLSMFQE